MATQVQLRRGTSTQNDAFTGATGELTYDTTNKRVRVHDGGTAGGFEIKTEDGSGNTIFADNEKAIFGAGADLQIYHDGLDSYIKENGTGNLLLSGTNIQIQDSSGHNFLFLEDTGTGGTVNLYHNASLKLATTSTGIQVTGNIANASGDFTLDVANNIILDSGDGDFEFKDTGTTFLNLYESGNIATFYNPINDADIRFQGKDGGSTITALTLDMSDAGSAYFNNNLYIPNYIYHSGDTNTYIHFPAGDNFQVVTAGYSRMKMVGSETSFNEDSADLDFRVESDTNTHALFVDGGTNAVHIGGSTDVDDHPLVVHSNTNANAIAIRGRSDDIGEITFYENDATTKLGGLQYRNTLTRLDNRINGATLDFATGAALTQSASFSSTQNIFNDGGVDMDFRIESDNNSTAFFVDASADKVQFGTNIGAATKIWFDNLESNDTYAYFGNNSSTTSNAPMFINRHASDGQLIQFRKASVSVGSIGTPGNGDVYISSGNIGLLISGSGTVDVYPCDDNGSARDNVADFGQVGARWDDIYATNGTIQTSDRNEKQDIEELSEAEQRVAVVAKGLMRKFRWKDKVAEKGDNARTHFGIIAQDLQDAFIAEGLDAGDYAMFTSSTWTDDDGNEQTRLGVRYNQLLAFIISAI
jgi:hypothetical protein